MNRLLTNSLLDGGVVEIARERRCKECQELGITVLESDQGGSY